MRGPKSRRRCSPSTTTDIWSTRLQIIQPQQSIIMKSIKSSRPQTKDDSYFKEIEEQVVDQIDIIEEKISFKLVVIGESFVGKTSLIKRFVQGKYADQYNVTVGVDFSSSVMEVEGRKVQLQIWDTCGHDVYKSMTASFYRGACGAIVTFAIDSRASFDKAKIWHQQFRQQGSPFAFIFLVGTKVDEQRQIQAEQAMSLMKNINGTFYVQTSSETGNNIQQLFQKCAEIMYKQYNISPDFRALANPRRHHKSSVLVSSVHKSNLKGKKKCCA